MAIHRVFTDQAANGNSIEVLLPRNEATGKRADGPVTVHLADDIGGGNIQLEVSPDDGTTWIPIGATITTLIAFAYQSVVGTRLRLALAGSTTPNLDAWIAVADPATTEV